MFNRPFVRSDALNRQLSAPLADEPWLSFLGRLQPQPKSARAHDQMLIEFREFMEKDRGLSPVTVEDRCHSVRPFLDQLLSEHRSLDMISVADIDALLAQRVNNHHYARGSVWGLRVFTALVFPV